MKQYALSQSDFGMFLDYYFKKKKRRKFIQGQERIIIIL